MFTLACQNLQVEAYRDMITPVVDAFKYLTQVVSVILIYVLCLCYCLIYECICTPFTVSAAINFDMPLYGHLFILQHCSILQLEYDILQYIVIERLAQGGRAKLKDDGLNLSDWLQCLASFWGHLYVPFDFAVILFWYYTCDIALLHFISLC